MNRRLFFSASAKIWDSIEWVHHIEENGFQGWEIVADGSYRLENREALRKITEALESTSLQVTVHAPYGDLNLATLNDPIRTESIRQIRSCISIAAELTDRVTIHPGYLSPVGKLLPDMAWKYQKEALVEIGKHAADCGVLACLENMIGIREFLCRFPDELIGMTEGMEGIGITIDIGHANTVDRVREFLPLVNRADHVHVHDNHGISDEHLPLGEGNIPWDLVGRTIAADYHGVVVIEGRSLEEGRKSHDVYRRCFV